MKIVRIIARLNVGGPARHVVWLTRALQNDKFDSILIAGTVPTGEEDMSYFAAENDVEPVYITAMSRELSPKDIVSLWKVFQQLRLEKPDIIHTHTAKAGTVGRVAGFFYRWLTWRTLLGKPRPVKFVHTYHGHVFHSYYGKLKTKIFLLIEKTLALITDKIVVISAQQFDEIHGQFRVGRAKQFQIVPLGIDLEKFADAAAKRSILRDEIGAKDDEIIVGFVGRLTEIKNIPMLLEVAALYRKQLNANSPKLKFVIVGDGNLRADLEKQAAALDLNETVRFLGSRSDTDVFYAGFDIVALVSRNEGTPLSLIEAMANNQPVISTTIGGVRDLLGNVIEQKKEFAICERGIGAASENAENFWRGLLHLAENENLRETLGQNGKNFVAAEYGKNRLIADIAKLYSKLIGM